MDKETIVKLAQPAATFVLALSIISLPYIAKAVQTTLIDGVITVYHGNSCVK